MVRCNQKASLFLSCCNLSGKQAYWRRRCRPIGAGPRTPSIGLVHFSADRRTASGSRETGHGMQGGYCMTRKPAGPDMETLEYVRSMLRQLRAMAEGEGCDMLSFLIEMAHLEVCETIVGLQ